ncbi:hypothetical protein LV779_14200 [Streptomyces thinghirensis]|nr:hypothetical protein [Streptomyces thinghirensis]
MVSGSTRSTAAADAVPDIRRTSRSRWRASDARLVRDERIKHLNEKVLAEMPGSRDPPTYGVRRRHRRGGGGAAHRMLEAVHRFDDDAHCLVPRTTR